MLDEPDMELKAFSLKQLSQLVDQFWAEIAEAVPTMFVPSLPFSASFLPFHVAVKHCMKMTSSLHEKWLLLWRPRCVRSRPLLRISIAAGLLSFGRI
jgi:hypothetical protein